MHSEQQNSESLLLEQEKTHLKNQNDFFRSVFLCALFLWSCIGFIAYMHLEMIPDLGNHSQEKVLSVYRILTFYLLASIGFVHYYKKLLLNIVWLLDKEVQIAKKLFEPLSTTVSIGMPVVIFISQILADKNPKQFEELMTVALWVSSAIPLIHVILMWSLFIMFIGLKPMEKR